jgi:hypothetical protein
MHCPRCGTNATVGQQFCRSCGLSLEKVAELLGDELAVEPSWSIEERARLRERQRKFEQWGGIAGLVTFGLILLTLIFVVFSQIVRSSANLIPGALMVLLAIGAAVMGLFLTYSKSLTEKLANLTMPRAVDQPRTDQTRKLEGYREPVPTVTDRTTELLVAAKAADTGKMDD